MSIADKLLEKHGGGNPDIAREAEKLALDVNQDWSGEGPTLYQFEDGSALLLSGPVVYQVKAAQ